MFDDILLHPLTRSGLEKFVNSPSHALLIVAPTGAGKHHLARAAAASLLNVTEDKLGSHPYFIEIERAEDKKDIPIESVRQITKMLSLKAVGQQDIKRVVIINGAHHLNQQAQNAFLKSLEEPPQGTVFLLTANSTGNLLPTISSRTQKLVVNPVNLNSALSYFEDNYDQASITSAWQLSQGSVGMLVAVLSGANRPFQEALDQAKNIFRHNTYQRLIDFDHLSKNKESFSLTLEAMLRIVKALYRQAVSLGKESKAKSLLDSSKLIMQAQQSVQANVSLKLVALKLVLNLKV